MEQSRLNRPWVIPDYAGAEIKALLRDPMHISIIVTKKLSYYTESPKHFVCHIALVDYEFHITHNAL